MSYSYDRRVAKERKHIEPNGSPIDRLVEQAMGALDLLSHHKIHPKIFYIDPELGEASIELLMTPSMAQAYIENHLHDQLGSRPRFKVENGRTKLYVDLRAR